MGRTMSYPARQLRERRRRWLRERKVQLIKTAVGVVVLAVAFTPVIVLTVPDPLTMYSIGVLHAALVGIALHVWDSAFLSYDRGAMSQQRGAWGEDSIRDELQRARRRRTIWGWIDSVQLKVGDIDHVVVTRHGGIVVINSKWRNEVSYDDVTAMAASARRAALRAEGVCRTLLKREAGVRHRARTPSFAITPAVVVWGAVRDDVPPDMMRDGVAFIDGRQLLPWLASREGHEVSRAAARHLLHELRRYNGRVRVAEMAAVQPASRNA